jgi:hypothetical protein
VITERWRGAAALKGFRDHGRGGITDDPGVITSLDMFRDHGDSMITDAGGGCSGLVVGVLGLVVGVLGLVVGVLGLVVGVLGWRWVGQLR